MEATRTNLSVKLRTPSANFDHFAKYFDSEFIGNLYVQICFNLSITSVVHLSCSIYSSCSRLIKKKNNSISHVTHSREHLTELMIDFYARKHAIRDPRICFAPAQGCNPFDYHSVDFIVDSNLTRQGTRRRQKRRPLCSALSCYFPSSI